MNEFQDKVAIVTGATSGIGRAAAIAYAREGAKVVVAGRRATEGEETVRLLQAQGGEGIFVKTDVSKAVQVKELVERTLQKFEPDLHITVRGALPTRAARPRGPRRLDR